MKMKIHMAPLFLALTLSVFLSVGCAKKPAEPVTAAPPTAVAPEVPEQPAAEEPAGIQEERIAEAPVTERAAPGLPAAEAATIPELQRIFFDFDQYTLTPQAQQTLASNAQFMKARSNINVLIEGHCDERGSDEYNLALGERRARAAQEYMISLGIAPERLSTISYGEEQPLEPASNEAAWAKNRRAEFKAR